MASFVSTILHNSANKIESISKSKTKKNLKNNEQTENIISSIPNYYYYKEPKLSYNSNYITSPTIYDTLNNSWNFTEKTKYKSDIDRHSISQGIKLVSIATDEYEEGNESIALDIYLTGVDKIIMALPNKSNLNTKIAIKNKLKNVQDKIGLRIIEEENKNQIEPTLSDLYYQSILSDQSTNNLESIHKFKTLGNYLINCIISFIILFKQSPFPDILSFLFGHIFKFILWLDSKFYITYKIQDLTIQSLKFGIQLDEKYHLHEFITEGIYILFVATLKSIIAFKETPPFKSSK